MIFYPMKSMLLLILLVASSSCAPQIFYSGAKYLPFQSDEVAIFYDENQIGQPYQIIGTMADSGGSIAGPEKVKRAMVDKAQSVGADAILFHDVDVVHNDAFASMIIKAKAIRYESSENRTLWRQNDL